MRLRQVALVAAELEPVRGQLFSLLGIERDFADPGGGEFGLHNSVMALGDTFLEVVAPLREDTTAGRLLERRGGDGGYMVLLQVDDINPVRENVDALGIRRVWDIDRDEVSAFHVHPRDIGAAIVSFDEMRPPESWEWGGPDWPSQKARYVEAITGVEIQAVDVEAVATRWSRACERDLARDGDRFVLPMDDGGEISFVTASDGRGDGVSGFTVRACDRNAMIEAATKLDVPRQDDVVSIAGVSVRIV